MTIGKYKFNAFGAYYGAITIVFGILWWLALMVVQGVYQLVGQERVDPTLMWPIRIAQARGTAVLGLTNSAPVIEGAENLAQIKQSDKPVMFVANHCSYMDIPLLCNALGFEINYKIIS